MTFSGRDAEALDRGAVPQVDARDQRRLLVERQFAELSLSMRSLPSCLDCTLGLRTCAWRASSTAHACAVTI